MYYNVSQKNLTILFSQQLCQTTLYFDFWHTYTLVNSLSQAYFIFFINSKADNQLKFKQYSALAQRVRTTVKLLRHA